MGLSENEVPLKPLVNHHSSIEIAISFLLFGWHTPFPNKFMPCHGAKPKRHTLPAQPRHAEPTV